MAKGYKAQKGQKPVNMLQQLQKMQEQIQLTQEQLAQETVTATVGGGAVKIVMTGDQNVRSVVIDPAILEDKDVEMLQDLLLTAFNAALEQSRELAAERLGPLAGGLPF